MSKKQEKIAKNKAEQAAFIRERRKMQLALFENNFETGMQFYLSVKDKMKPEEVAVIEAQIEENKALLEKLRDEAYSDPEA
jgi:late competence protein required for DNA uptake (superfamily II DNA/RNA helicase)